MSQFKGTPAPWEVERKCDPHTGAWHDIQDHAGVVADTLNRHHCISPEEDRANAYLLAAAPDLLSACESLVHCAENGMVGLRECKAKAEAAIAKAVGS